MDNMQKWRKKLSVCRRLLLDRQPPSDFRNIPQAGIGIEVFLTQNAYLHDKVDVEHPYNKKSSRTPTMVACHKVNS